MMILDAFRLDDKVALVTGASRGIGAAIAVALAEAGADVALASRAGSAGEVEQRISALGRRTVQVTGDLTSPAEAPAIFDRALEHFGRIDILVNNAGLVRRSSALDHSAEDWQLVIDVDLNSVWRLCQAGGRHMAKHSGGKIINIASLMSFQGGMQTAAYVAAKHGVLGLTRALANEWAPLKINVNAIVPGYIATDINRVLREDRQRNEQLVSRIPAGHWGSPADLCGAAVFLASRASDYVHGTGLVVDGGWLSR
jgi:2-deoxy-D-gluconate 3-dehydrogenase